MKTRICHLPWVGDEVSGNIHGTEPRSVLSPSNLESAQEIHKVVTQTLLLLRSCNREQVQCTLLTGE